MTAARSATIGVNLLWLVPGVVGGSEEYTLRLLRALSDQEPDDLHLRIYGQAALFETHPDLIDRFTAVTAPQGPLGKVGRIGLEATWLAAASHDDDLVHHAGGVVPPVRMAPPVLTVHDLQPLELPHYFSVAKRTWLATMIPRSVQAARVTICPSRFTAEAIAARFGLSADRLAVVPQGLDGVTAGPNPPEVAAELAATYGRYLLYPAIAYPHKRHADVVRALAALAERHPDVSVVFSGRPGPETPSLEALATELGVADRLHIVGRVPVDRLDALYRSATAVAFPSAYEGFGNPVLEAMARGCPVIASDATALPEVVGDAGLTVPLGDVAALAAAAERLLTDSTLAAELADAGPVRSGRYTTPDAAHRLASAYRRALRPTREHSP
ncbi:MAG: glycosyltransferase family 1 protein [Actinomycetota bacterium]